MAKSVVQEFTKGLWAEIPPFRLVLGLCPTLAVTKSVENGVGMGVASTFVLVCSNVLISLFKNVIPKKVTDRLLHSRDSDLCDGGGVGDAGICLSVIFKVGHLYSADCGQLYCAGSSRGLCGEEQCGPVPAWTV